MDQELRRLERLADQGDQDALIRLVERQSCLGPPPYYREYSYFVRLRETGPSAHLGFPVERGPGGRWDASELEGEYFHIYFTTNDQSAFLVLARQPDDIDPQNLGSINEYLNEGFVPIDDIIPLQELTIKDFYHHHAYRAGNIMEHEDAPQWPDQTIQVVVKRPGQDPVVESHLTSDRFMNRLVDGVFQMVPIRALPGVSLFVNEMGHGLPPNFQIPPGDAFHFQFWHQVITGTAVFSRLQTIDPENLPWHLLPWPWGEKGQEDPDSVGDIVPWPTSLEWGSLTDEEIEEILSYFA